MDDDPKLWHIWHTDADRSSRIMHYFGLISQANSIARQLRLMGSTGVAVTDREGDPCGRGGEAAAKKVDVVSTDSSPADGPGTRPPGI